jgi:hypothetical protein
MVKEAMRGCHLNGALYCKQLTEHRNLRLTSRGRNRRGLGAAHRSSLRLQFVLGCVQNVMVVQSHA